MCENLTSIMGDKKKRHRENSNSEKCANGESKKKHKKKDKKKEKCGAYKSKEFVDDSASSGDEKNRHDPGQSSARSSPAPPARSSPAPPAQVSPAPSTRSSPAPSPPSSPAPSPRSSPVPSRSSPAPTPPSSPAPPSQSPTPASTPGKSLVPYACRNLNDEFNAVAGEGSRGGTDHVENVAPRVTIPIGVPLVEGLEHKSDEIAEFRETHKKEGVYQPNFCHIIVLRK